MKKIELLAPAGNLEKLQMALMYGADAVYIGGELFSLRAYADNFSIDDMKKGVKFAHKLGKKVYLTINIFAHNKDIEILGEYIPKVADTGIDAVIVSDPGVFLIVKEAVPDLEIHLSTQANNTNWKSSRFWHEQGVKRIILARELSLEEIKEIRAKTPADLEFEMFVHGAMCISYSGRCLLSNYMAARDANKGLCAGACRWKYYLMEEQRPGEYMPFFEDDKGSYIFNSKDLCLIEYLPQIIEAGISSIKIEGRMKSSFYVASIVSGYRRAIDAYYNNPDNYVFDSKIMEEISKVSHRDYTTGFFLNKPDADTQIYNTSSYIRGYDFVGVVKAYDNTTKIAKIEQRNKINLGDEIEILRPDGSYFTQIVKEMKNEEGAFIESAPHAQMIMFIPMEQEAGEFSLLRKKSL